MSELSDILDRLDATRPEGIWGSVIHLGPVKRIPEGIMTLHPWREKDGRIFLGLKVHISNKVPDWAAVFCDHKGNVLGVVDLRGSYPPVAESPVATIRAGADAHSDALKSGEPVAIKAEGLDEVEEQGRSEPTP